MPGLTKAMHSPPSARWRLWRTSERIRCRECSRGGERARWIPADDEATASLWILQEALLRTSTQEFAARRVRSILESRGDRSFERLATLLLESLHRGQEADVAALLALPVVLDHGWRTLRPSTFEHVLVRLAEVASSLDEPVRTAAVHWIVAKAQERTRDRPGSRALRRVLPPLTRALADAPVDALRPLLAAGIAALFPDENGQPRMLPPERGGLPHEIDRAFLRALVSLAGLCGQRSALHDRWIEHPQAEDATFLFLCSLSAPEAERARFAQRLQARVQSIRRTVEEAVQRRDVPVEALAQERSPAVAEGAARAHILRELSSLVHAAGDGVRARELLLEALTLDPAATDAEELWAVFADPRPDPRLRALSTRVLSVLPDLEPEPAALALIAALELHSGAAARAQSLLHEVVAHAGARRDFSVDLLLLRCDRERGTTLVDAADLRRRWETGDVWFSSHRVLRAAVEEFLGTAP